MTTILTNTGWEGDLSGTWTDGADLVNAPVDIFVDSGTVANMLAGDDSISASGRVGGIDNRGTIETGNGNDSISGSGGGSGIQNLGTINTGEGNDSISGSGGVGTVNVGTINTGSGDDSISGSGDSDGIGTVNFGTINTGNGNDSILGSGPTGIFNTGTINTGNGDDTLISKGVFFGGGDSRGKVFLGNGSDYLKGFGDGSFDGGKGSDTLELTTGTYTVGISGATVSFTGSNGFFDATMNTTGFEQLIAGSNTYAFSNLSDGQRITF